MTSGVKHYKALVEGLFALRAVGEPLSQETEAEIAEIHDDLWRRLSPAERDVLDGDHGIIEEVKKRWTAVSTVERVSGVRPDIPGGFWLGELTGQGGHGLCHVFEERAGENPQRLPHTAVCGASTGRGAELVTGEPTRRLCSNCKEWLDG